MTSAATTSLWSRIKHTLFSAEAAAARKKRLVRDIAQSPIQDIRSILKTADGKFSVAPSSASTPANSTTLPIYRAKAISGDTLDLTEYCRGRVTMLAISFSAYSEPQLETFRKPFLSEFLGQNGAVSTLPSPSASPSTLPSASPSTFPSTSTWPYQLLDMRPIMNRFKWLIFAALLRSTASTVVPVALHSSYVVPYRPMVLFDALAIPNHLGAFVYLIDGEGRVRWGASGEAHPAELEAMRRISKQLRSELGSPVNP